MDGSERVAATRCIGLAPALFHHKVVKVVQAGVVPCRAPTRSGAVLVHILAVDDDEKVRSLLFDYLTQEGFRVTVADSCATMQAALERERADLILLDLRLPDGDGLMLVRQLRSESHVPVIILSGKAEEVDRIVGLELGADDYLTKPFNPRELLARIRAVLRRVSDPPTPRAPEELRAVVEFADWQFDLMTQRLKAPDGRDIELTKAEFALLTAFVKRPQRVLSRDQLLDL